ncbi:hypothetical protein J2Y54_000840 [Sphingomonas sp. BE123]|jgi:hypothetical protein|uniref:hypothetical protein n=1 Tax=unclassified Sphingomonas TaxID=196159 RepID=UPI00285FF0CE|nr:hypothetical protein [Sphingomonas sp. BE123]MDR6851347.1 hypothetical protein [Sphingomonas sp. BE123]
MRPELSPAANMTLSLLLIAAAVLVWGGVTMLRKGDRTKGVLMIVCAVVLVGNVLIWTV